MAIGWPEDHGQAPPARKARPEGLGWVPGEVHLSDDDLWGAGGRQRLTGRQRVGLVVLIALLVVVGLAVWAFGPLPTFLPRDCVGCFFVRS